MSISWGTQYPKLKTNLRLAINRLKLMGKKKTEMAMKARTEIADYILAHKEDRARIRVEHIIREDFLVEAYELLEMYCDLLLARFGLIEQMKTLDDGIAEAVISILWAAPRIATDIAEFKTISDQLTHKYGKPFAEAARANQLEYPAKVAPKLIAKLSANAPPKLLVEKYMIEIATAAGVPFTPDPDVIRDDEILQAEKMLIDFKQQGEGGVPVSHDGMYGWNLPGGPPPPGGFGHPGGGPGHFGNTGGHLGPGLPPGVGSGYIGGERKDDTFPPPGDAPPPPPPPHNYGGDGGNRGGGNIYEVPSGLPHSHYDQVPGAGGYQNHNVFNAQQSTGVIQLPQIGPNGLPIMPGGGGNTGGAGGNYPILSQRNSMIQDNKASLGGPSAPPQSLKKPDDAAELNFPEPPSSFVGGAGNGGGSSGGGDIDFDELAKRFDQLKKK